MSYHYQIQYQTYDVTDRMRAEIHEIRITLADEWYKGNLGSTGQHELYGDKRQLLLQLCLDAEDGSQDIVVTDESWFASTGPIQRAEIYHGETYDARIDAPLGTAVEFEHAEILDHKGNFYTDNLRSAKQTVTYICSGRMPEMCVLTNLIATAFYAHSTSIVADAAAILSRPEDVKRYRLLHSRIVERYREIFLRPDGTFRVRWDADWVYRMMKVTVEIPANARAQVILHQATVDSTRETGTSVRDVGSRRRFETSVR